MSEVIEHELNQLNGQAVVVVRPGFGTQSDSWTGVLETQGNAYPLQFCFRSAGQSIVFTAEDVTKVEQTASGRVLAGTTIAVVRLKGPQQYMTEPVHA
jgi:hypothetical protein